MKQFWQQRKWWIIGGIALAILAILVLPRVLTPPTGAQGPALGSAQTPTTTAVTERVEAFIGDLSNEASASGEVVAQREAALAMLTTGTIDEVTMRVGDTVTAGEPLVQLDTADLTRMVESAQQALAAQKANLETLIAPATASERTAAEATVASAQAALDDMKDGPNESELAAAQANLQAAQADLAAASARLSSASAAPSAAAIQAAQLELSLAQQAATTAAEQHSTILVTEPNQFLSADRLADLELAARTQAQQANANLAAAQQAYDDLVNGDPSSVSASQATVASAAAQRDAAQAQLDLLNNGPTATQLAAAQATLAQAQLRLEQLMNGPSDAQRTQAEVAVEKANIALQRAQKNLTEATLVAPFDGVITQVNAQTGESAAGVLAGLYDPHTLEVVLDVDEVDVAQVQPGQQATITLETWPDEEIPAEVAAILPQATAGTDLVTFKVYLTLGETTLPVRVGMTANARLAADTKEGVLLLPNGAIQSDRSRGTYAVVRITQGADGQDVFETVPVTIGLRDGRYTEITSGLQAGDEVAIGNDLPVVDFSGPPDQEQQPQGGGNPFGG